MVVSWGLVIAGGSGKRIGGNKHLRRVINQRLIDRAVNVLKKVGLRVVVIIGNRTNLFDMEAPVIKDFWPGFGPLNAIGTVFFNKKVESVLVLPVDLPFVKESVLKRILINSDGYDAVIPLSSLGVEPLIGYYHRRCLPMILSLIRYKEKRPKVLLQLVKTLYLSTKEIFMMDPEEISFININTLEDLKMARFFWGNFKLYGYFL